MNKMWLKAAVIRALRTFAQNAAAMITIGAAVEEVKWMQVLSVSAVAAIYSILMSLSGLPEIEGTEKGTKNGNKDNL